MLKFITALLFAQVLLAAPMPEVQEEQDTDKVLAQQNGKKNSCLSYD